MACWPAARVRPEAHRTLKRCSPPVEIVAVAPDPAPPHPAPPRQAGQSPSQVFARAVASGEVVFDVGQPAGCVYAIQAGEVELSRPGPCGPRLLGCAGAGELFGEDDLLLGQPRTQRAVARAPTQLLELDRATFEAMCLERPEIALRIVARLCARVSQLERRLAGIGIPDLREPVVRSLLRRTGTQGQAVRLQTSLRELAADTGLSLLECHRALEGLFQRKLLRLEDDALVIPDPQALCACLPQAASPAPPAPR